MLYLLRTHGKEKSLLKIGYATDLYARLYQYESHNPYIEVIGKREGTLEDELLLHLYLHVLGLGILKDEWYKDCDEVINVFNTYSETSEIESVIWTHRQELFELDYGSTRKMGLFRKLFDNIYKLSNDEYDVSSILQSEVSLDRKFYSRIEDKKLADVIPDLKDCPEEVNVLYTEFQVDNNFERRMRLVYEFYTSHQSVYNKYRKYIWNFLPGNFQNYINILGFDKIRANSYKESDILKVFDSVKKKDEVSSAIYSKFEVGERYSLKYIKGVLKEIYNNLGVSGVYMASELEKYFEVKKCKVSNSDGTRDAGYLIIRKKERE